MIWPLIMAPPLFAFDVAGGGGEEEIQGAAADNDGDQHVERAGVDEPDERRAEGGLQHECDGEADAADSGPGPVSARRLYGGDEDADCALKLCWFPGPARAERRRAAAPTGRSGRLRRSRLTNPATTPRRQEQPTPRRRPLRAADFNHAQIVGRSRLAEGDAGHDDDDVSGLRRIARDAPCRSRARPSPRSCASLRRERCERPTAGTAAAKSRCSA